MTTLGRLLDASAFLREAGPFLVEREAEHNLMLGLAGRLVDDPDAYGEPAYAAVVRDHGGTVVAAALRTPPFNLILSETAEAPAVGLIAADVWDRYGELPGVAGPTVVAARFVRVWAELSGVSADLVLQNRIYRVERAIAPSEVPGSARLYDDADRQIVVGWMTEFVREALPPGQHPEDPEETLARRLREAEGGLMLWQNEGRPVSMAGWGGPTPNGMRIGPVYTPPEHRRRGYATALTALVTDRLLRSGRRFCFLYTDLANPTSNAIYQRIGYEPVSDVDQYRLGPPADA